MIVTIDNNTKPVELYHLSILFQSLAKAHGFIAPVASNKVSELTVELNMDTIAATVAIGELADLIDRTGVKVEDVPPVTATGEFLDPIVSLPSLELGIDTSDLEGSSAKIDAALASQHLDSSGLPWDARIHAGSRERNTDGSWRVRRRPKDTDQDEWDATLARVTAELTDLMAIPVSPGAVADAAAEEREIGDVHHTAHALTDAEVDAFIGALEGAANGPTDDEVQALVNHEVVATLIAPPVTIAPPVVVPPVNAVAPPISDKPAIETFPQVMVWLTAHTPKDEAAKPVMVAKVNQILTDNGLTVLQQLNQRPDLIPQIMAQFLEAFGE